MLHIHRVNSVTEGPETVFEAGRLVVSTEWAAAFFEADCLSQVRVGFVAPGESVRLVKVLDVVEPRAGDGIFPGFAAAADAPAGDVHVLQGAAVVVAGFLPRAQEALVDFSGPAAALSFVAQCNCVVVEFEPAENPDWGEVEKALRNGQLALAAALAETARGDTGETAPEHKHRASGLPVVGTITNLQTQGSFKDVYYRGASFAKEMPRSLDPGELDSGAVVSGQFGHPGLKNPTYVFQNHPVVAALRELDGDKLVFGGVIISPEPVEQARKEEVSAAAAALCKELGWQGVIITKEGGGNADSDMSLKVDALEKMNIRTAAIFAEMSGPEGTGPPVVSPPSAPGGLVSSGNYDEPLELPEMDRALGGEELALTGQPAAGPQQVVTAAVYGSLSPIGMGRLKAEEAPGAAGAELVEKLSGNDKIAVVHYINQFFAGKGGEDQAGTGPFKLDELPPLSRRLAALLGDRFELSAVVACGDDYASAQDKAGEEVVEMAGTPDLLICGPAFTSGRYGIACTKVAQAATAAGIPVLAAMNRENPGISGSVPTVSVGETARQMGEALEAIAKVAGKIAAGEAPTEGDGLLVAKARKNIFSEVNAAGRAVELVLRRIEGDVEATEIPLPDFGKVTPAPPVGDPAEALVALLTEGGLVPSGNPERLESARATKWLRYRLEDMEALVPGEFQSVHGGFSTVAANEDPNRILPLDAAIQLQAEGRIGTLLGEYLVTVGNGTTVARATKFGVEWGAELRKAGVQAAILTST